MKTKRLYETPYVEHAVVELEGGFCGSVVQDAPTSDVKIASTIPRPAFSSVLPMFAAAAVPTAEASPTRSENTRSMLTSFEPNFFMLDFSLFFATEKVT